jgi:SAM-dependent methyltransferase
MASATHSHTVAFDWDLRQFEALVDYCNEDESIQLALRNLPKDGPILEAGCGPGHVVHYLQERGYQVDGIEINEAVVRAVREKFPRLPIISGDVAAVPVPDGHYAGLVSFGVIEHFRAGPEAPLREHHRVLRPGGIAVISVPAQNYLRRLKQGADALLSPLKLKRNNLLRRIFGRPPVRRNRVGRDGFRYRVFPLYGAFFEYRLTPAEFERQVQAAGFRIRQSVPTHHLVGLWDEGGSRLVKLSNRHFRPTALGRKLNRFFSLVPGFHNHMQTIVAEKI